MIGLVLALILLAVAQREEARTLLEQRRSRTPQPEKDDLRNGEEDPE